MLNQENKANNSTSNSGLNREALKLDHLATLCHRATSSLVLPNIFEKSKVRNLFQ